MPVSTPNLGLQKPSVGGDVGLWGGELNGNFDTLDKLAAQAVVIVAANGTSVFAPSSTIEFCAGGAGGITRTLPTAVGNAGRTFTYKKTDAAAGSVTIAAAGGQTVDGVATYVLVNQFQYVVVSSDGTNWNVIGGS